jgi:2,5-diamino-6-(ribosylamino)-4(3H)-pyrimidinone 5'-phosphate reductase
MDMRPYVIVNVAVSADGKLSTRERRQVKISGSQDFKRVDTLKAGCDAIMVGIGTVLADDPSLTIKSPDHIAERTRQGKSEHPVRIVVDSHARTPPDAKILHKGSGRRIVAVSEAAPTERIQTLKSMSDVIIAGKEQVVLTYFLHKLSEQGISRLMVEGGGTLIWGLISEGLVDELYMFVGNIIIGGYNAPTLADGPGYIKESDFPTLKLISTSIIEEGVLIHWKMGN